jgi:death on curing protein
MTVQPTFLEVDQVLEIHGRMVRDFGGDPAVRDRGLLESAVRIPQATFDGRLLHEDITSMAAAYLFHLCMNHPFVDGKTRTALATAEVFLLLNDRVLQAEDAAVEELTMALASSKASKEEVTVFFRENTVPVRGGCPTDRTNSCAEPRSHP